MPINFKISVSEAEMFLVAGRFYQESHVCKAVLLTNNMQLLFKSLNTIILGLAHLK